MGLIRNRVIDFFPDKEILHSQDKNRSLISSKEVHFSKEILHSKLKNNSLTNNREVLFHKWGKGILLFHSNNREILLSKDKSKEIVSYPHSQTKKKRQWIYQTCLVKHTLQFLKI